MNEIKKLKDLVLNVLKELPETRDNDNLLVVTIWKQNNLSNLENFYELYLNGQITSADTILRCRRKLQELIPEVRGENYQLRQAHTGQVKQELKTFMDKKDRSKVRQDIKNTIEKMKPLDFSNAQQLGMF